MTEALAYYGTKSITDVKRFKVQAPEVNVLNTSLKIKKKCKVGYFKNATFFLGALKWPSLQKMVSTLTQKIKSRIEFFE
jgi:hypothetical protein